MEKHWAELYISTKIASGTYGSYLYGTNDDESDLDLIVVVPSYWNIKDDDRQWAWGDTDYQFYTEEEFIQAIKDHKLWAIELLSQEKATLISYRQKYFNLDLWKLRKEVSGISSNSFVKAKKKMTIEKDYDLRKAKKSLFHSIRVLMFGIQIAKNGKIVDFAEANKYLDEINAMESNNWEDYRKKYKKIQNYYHSELVKLCPMPKENE